MNMALTESPLSIKIASPALAVEVHPRLQHPPLDTFIRPYDKDRRYWNRQWVRHTDLPPIQTRHVHILSIYSCWLLEVAQEFPQSFQLDGFDISSSQFPAVEFLPGNITLKTMDVFGEIPDELVGKYDMIHVRAFAIVIKGGDPGPLLDNLIKMLSTPIHPKSHKPQKAIS